jgi:hypothetical protein
MKNLIMLPIMLLFLGACVSDPVIKYVDRPIQVEIMVPADIPEPPSITRPFLPVRLLTEENITDPDKIAKYYVKSLYLMENYADKLQCALDAYRTETAPQCPVTFREQD